MDDYRILWNYDIEKLEASISDAIQHGWKPYGNLAFGESKDGVEIWCQAIIGRETE